MVSSAAVVDPGGDPLQHRESARAGDRAGSRRAAANRRRRSRPGRRRLQRDERGEQRRRHRAIDARHAGERLAHRPPGIERHDDIVVALGAIFLGDEPGVARRLSSSRSRAGPCPGDSRRAPRTRRPRRASSWAIWPCIASRLTSCALFSRTGRMSGAISTGWSSPSWRCFQTSPTGRSSAPTGCSSTAVPRRSASIATSAAPRPASSAARARQPCGAATGPLSAERDLGGARGPSARRRGSPRSRNARRRRPRPAPRRRPRRSEPGPGQGVEQAQQDEQRDQSEPGRPVSGEQDADHQRGRRARGGQTSTVRRSDRSTRRLRLARSAGAITPSTGRPSISAAAESRSAVAQHRRWRAP